MANYGPRKFQSFVRHRVGEIVDSTNRNQWRWVPTKENVADLATKFFKTPDAYRWINGPPFLLHMFHENLIRSQFYIARLRILYKNVRKACQKCKNSNSSPQVPQMAPIPAARLACFERPFTYTGVDYFGPILVHVGRHKEKLWGVLFTCLTPRAVHIEVAYKLDVSACIMCLKSFMALRGTPKEIFSDNGTNFKATEKVVQEDFRKIDFNDKTIQYEAIKWRFSPPAAPHMGGAWERLVRSVKTIQPMTPR
ncbi:uncharacterized protein [Drosophila takahashii]|uniref:uncharacterized protein n=1 Tax=Drosophila takahashii TaxID=29030 RepID=UPI0038990882